MSDNTSRSGPGDSRRAVSPVIGVILMVAITVILAAVIGAFVLEIGDQQETAPNASFQTDERVVTLKNDRWKNKYGGSETIELNTTQIYATHAGGDTLPISQMEVVVDGHKDVWGVHPGPNALDVADGPVSDSVDLAPQPDFRQTMGTNREVTLGSGESWNAIMFHVLTWAGGNGPSEHPNVQEGLTKPGTFDTGEPAVSAGKDYIYFQQFAATDKYHNTGDALIEFRTASGTSGGAWGAEHLGYGVPLEDGSTMSVVWSAESGGKTQTLFKHTAQHDETGDKEQL